jgi:alanyl-tRNA synthetase
LVPAHPLCDNVGIVSTHHDEAQVTGDATKLKWSGNEIRETFLRFFESKGHRRVRSSSLVPHGDPTLLFTNAGMNQFKDVFLGLEKRDYNKATTAQKCVRAGGKHNDLENVGFTKRHHTFFEMMGNFSFGDYFKEKAIPYAWELITSPEWFNIPKDKLYVTVFGGAEVAPGTVLGVDEDARKIWLDQNVPAERVVPIPGLKDNFWAMGDTGPCGPCSEIFYDMGPVASEEGHPDCKFPCDCGRYVEIWNLVFMQFNRDANGTLTPLPKPCVDTGLGLERTAAVLQGVISNYDTDLFVPLLQRAAELCGVDEKKEEKLEEGRGGAASLRVIADHARAATFLVADGVVPSNEGRGYVLRKIIRRAIRHGRLLGASKPFLGEMVDSVRRIMCVAYPELTAEESAFISDVVSSEETRFLHTLDTGLRRLERLINIIERGFTALSILEVQDHLGREQDEPVGYAVDQLDKWRDAGFFTRKEVPGQEAFRLYDTFGLPVDFIEDTIRDAGMRFDREGFEHAMREQKTRARASWKGAHKEAASPAFSKIAETFKTEKDFYKATSGKDIRIEAIIGSNGPVNELKAGESGEVVLDRTPIYAESGGQVGDKGSFYDNSGSHYLAEVTGA